MNNIFILYFFCHIC